MFKVEVKDPFKDLSMKADIQKRIDEAFQEINVEAKLQQGYDMSDLNVRSGVLYNSFTSELIENGIKIRSIIPYARIQDLGGWTGRNYASYIKPTHYVQTGLDLIRDELFLNLSKRFK